MARLSRLQGELEDILRDDGEGLSPSSPEGEPGEGQKEEEPGEGQPNKKGKGNGKKRRATGSQAEAKKRGTASVAGVGDDGLKKCSRCKVSKEAGEFNKDQSKCKGCNNEERGFKATLQSQMGAWWLNKTSTADPQLLAEVEKRYVAARAIAGKEGKKLVFNAKVIIEEVKATTGKRFEREAPMMWEGQYKEWAGSAAGGFLTPDEAQAQWDAWDKNEFHCRDWDGPRGYMQLAVTGYAKRVVEFDEVAKSKSYKGEQKLGKNLTEEQLARKVSTIGNFQEDGQFDEMRQRMSARIGSSGKASSSGDPAVGVFAQGGLQVPALRDLMKKRSAGSRRR